MRFDSQRQKMINDHLILRGIEDEKVLQAFKKVKRHLFVPEGIRHLSYNDSPLSIGDGQTISQPYIVALMLQLLELQPADKVLEIGTGSGYQTALIAEIVEEIYTVERISNLMLKAKQILKELKYENIYYRTGDGTLGWKGGNPKCSKFNKIIVAAAAPDIPSSLIEQLAINGKLIIPTGNRMFQKLVVITKSPQGVKFTNHGGCAFVPLLGEEGW